jgi:hypothetical protein
LLDTDWILADDLFYRFDGKEANEFCTILFLKVWHRCTGLSSLNLTIRAGSTTMANSGHVPILGAAGGESEAAQIPQ